MSIQLTRRGLALGKPSTPPAGRTAWTVGMLTREAKSSAALVPVLVSIRRPENRRCDWRDRRDINKMDWNTMCREELRYSHWKDNPSRRELWDRWISRSHHTYGRKKGAGASQRSIFLWRCCRAFPRDVRNGEVCCRKMLPGLYDPEAVSIAFDKETNRC
jgi:hypothetical protein